MNKITTERTLEDIVETYDRLCKGRDAHYDKMMDEVSVNEAGEASAEEVLACNEWYEKSTEDLKEWFKTAIQPFIQK